MELLERGDELRRLDALARSGDGRLVLVSGEAGIGKTALVRAAADPRALWGACDALHTPRPLGPFLDVADAAGARPSAPTPAAVVRTLADRLAPRTTLVLEDLHWADQASLDALRLLARRLPELGLLVLATARDVEPSHPLRTLLGELPPATLERVRLAPLSPEAVAALPGADAHPDPAALHRRTAGNPFYATEVLAAGDAVPDSVRDAVLARCGRLPAAARELLDAVAIMPARAELAVLEALAGPALDGLDEALASGVLHPERDGVAFRHEIARVAVEDALPPHRRAALHRRTLAALEAGGHDAARLAHHAEGAGDAAAVLQHAPRAAERAAALGAHREAAAQFERALAHAEGLPPAERASLLERWSYECYLTDRIADAIDGRRRALAEHRTTGDRVREGDAHRWLSRLAWFAGDGVAAEAEARRAIALLEPLGEGPELAMAWSTLSQQRMLAGDGDGAVLWGERAIALAEALGLVEVLAHALNNVGTARMVAGLPGGREALERSLALALDAGLEEHVARAHTNLASSLARHRALAEAEHHLRAGIAYCTERDLDAWRLYLPGDLAVVDLEAGRWDDAAATAGGVLAHPELPPPSRISPLVVLGRLRARRGDPGAWEALDEALELAEATGELQRLGPVGVARAEARWLTGQPERVPAETDAALALALERGDGWFTAELLAWRRRAGDGDDPPTADLPGPHALELGGDHTGAAAAWDALGVPYEAALARAGAPAEALQAAGLQALQDLGARAAARVVARGLRRIGARGLPRGPRAATRENPAGLTARELEVLALLADGLRNAEIAARLHLSQKTVAHHVSAVLRKLGVPTRARAAAEASRLGLVAR